MLRYFTVWLVEKNSNGMEVGGSDERKYQKLSVSEVHNFFFFFNLEAGSLLITSTYAISHWTRLKE